jgi:hypothetical protein
VRPQNQCFNPGCAHSDERGECLNKERLRGGQKITSGVLIGCKEFAMLLNRQAILGFNSSQRRGIPYVGATTPTYRQLDGKRAR